MFLIGSSLLEIVGIVSTCTKVLNYCKADVFKVYLLIFITSIPFPSYQVLAFASMGSGMKFEHLLDFLSALHYFTRLFLVTTWEIRRINFNKSFNPADVERIVDKRKLTVCWQVECMVVALLVDMVIVERFDPSRLDFPRYVQEVDFLYREKNLLAGWKNWWNRPLLLFLFDLFDFRGV